MEPESVMIFSFHYDATERAKGGVGLQIVENVSIQEQVPSHILRIHSDAVIPGFNELAESIKGWGARAGIQLNPMGLLKPTMNVNQITPDLTKVTVI